MAKTKENKMKENSDSKLFAFLATFLTIIGFVIALVIKRDDKYVMFYAKQGLVLFILCIIIEIVSWIPITGWILEVPLWILFVVVWIMAWMNSLSGKMKNTFLIGNFAEKIKL